MSWILFREIKRYAHGEEYAFREWAQLVDNGISWTSIVDFPQYPITTLVSNRHHATRFVTEEGAVAMALVLSMGVEEYAPGGPAR